MRGMGGGVYKHIKLIIKKNVYKKANINIHVCRFYFRVRPLETRVQITPKIISLKGTTKHPDALIPALTELFFTN